MKARSPPCIVLSFLSGLHPKKQAVNKPLAIIAEVHNTYAACTLEMICDPIMRQE